MSGPIDPDATMPVPGGGYPGAGDPTIATPPGGQGGGPTSGGGQGGDWDDEGGDRRRLWLIAGGVLVLGLLVGALVAVLAGGDDSGDTTTTSSSTTSTSTSTSSSTTTTSTTAVTQPAAVQILAFSVTPNPIPDGTCPDGGGSVDVTVKWGTANTQSVAVGIDGPGPYRPPYSAQTGQDTLPFECGGPGETVQHTYYLTAYAGPGTSGASKQQTIVVSGTTPDGP